MSLPDHLLDEPEDDRPICYKCFFDHAPCDCPALLDREDEYKEEEDRCLKYKEEEDEHTD